MASKRKLSALLPEAEEPVDPTDELMFLCLGGGNEVGRSCHIIQYKGKTVMVLYSSLLCDQCLRGTFLKLDAGIHPAYEGLAALPYYDEFDLSTVDVLLISQYVTVLVSYTKSVIDTGLADTASNCADTIMGHDWCSVLCADAWSLLVLCNDMGFSKCRVKSTVNMSTRTVCGLQFMYSRSSIASQLLPSPNVLRSL